MAEPVAYTLIYSRLRSILAARTKTEPAASMQLRIQANHSAAVLWWFGNGRGYGVVWYDREESAVALTSDYYTALDQFCQLCKIPPLDSRQPYAKLWEQAQEEARRAASTTTAPSPAAVPVVADAQTVSPVVPAAQPTPPPPVPARTYPTAPPMNGRRLLRSQLETA